MGVSGGSLDLSPIGCRRINVLVDVCDFSIAQFIPFAMGTLRVSLRRPDPSHPWGFRIAGGKDFGTPVTIRKVNPNGQAGRHGVSVGDIVIDIGGDSTAGMTHQMAQQAIIRCGNELDLQLFRGPVSAMPLSLNPAPPQPSPGLYRSNRGIQLNVNNQTPSWQSPGASTSSMDSIRGSPMSPPAGNRQPSAMTRLERTLAEPGKPLPMGYSPTKVTSPGFGSPTPKSPSFNASPNSSSGYNPGYSPSLNPSRTQGQPGVYNAPNRAPAGGYGVNKPTSKVGTRRGQSQRHQAGSRGPMDRDPICDSCHSLIRGPFIVALDRCYCPEHFRCDQCGIRMENCGFVEEAGQLLCETDYARFLAPRCGKCGLPVVERIVSALRQSWHPACFCCAACKRQLAGSEPGPGEASFRVGEDNRPYCEADWAKLFQAKCEGCGYSIDEMDQFIEALGKNYHSACFCCSACKCSLDGKPFVSREGKAFCKAHARAAAIF